MRISWPLGPSLYLLRKYMAAAVQITTIQHRQKILQERGYVARTTNAPTSGEFPAARLSIAQASRPFFQFLVQLGSPRRGPIHAATIFHLSPSS